MRLTLAEAAYCLGCGPDTVISHRNPAYRAVEDKLELYLRATEFSQEYKSALRTWLLDGWADRYPVGAKIDSREVKPGDIFFCLRGEKVDGHDFALDAVKAGAVAIVAEEDPFWNTDKDDFGDDIVFPPIFLVPDCVKALGRLAACHRNTSLATVIGLTGTAGKTSVKEVLSQVLAVRGHTERTPMNLNNQIGLPLSMLNSSAEASFWVIEAGISNPHDMDELGEMLRPDAALILNAGSGHLLGLGDKGTASYKARLMDYVIPEGQVFISSDYPELRAETEARAVKNRIAGVEVIYFSTAQDKTDVACTAVYKGPASEDTGRYMVTMNGRQYGVRAPFRGTYGSENVAAVFVTAFRLGLTIEEILSGLAEAVLPQQRFLQEKAADFVIINDSYNSNPLSAARMIEAARLIAWEDNLPLYLVLGEMLELGEFSEKEHLALGKRAALSGAKGIFWKGAMDEQVQVGLDLEHYEGFFYNVNDRDDLMRSLNEAGMKNGLVLFKGSRSNKLEILVDAFRDWAEENFGQKAGGEADDF